jgi:hypothetical protein
MTALGDVLEVIFAPSGPPVSFHAIVREWSDPKLAEEAGDTFVSELKANLPAVVRLFMVPLRVGAWVKYRGRSEGPAGPKGDSQLEVWRDGSGRVRLERSWNSIEGSERLTTLARPATSAFKFAPQKSFDHLRAKSFRHGGRWPAPSIADAENLFDLGHLRELLSELEIVPIGESTIAGRAVLEVTARQRSAFGLWPHWLPAGADHFELSFDVAHGLLLRSMGKDANGTVFESQEVTSMEYGEDVAERLLTIP